MNNIAMNTKISGEYNLVITSADGTVRETGWFPNLILNQGLNRFGDTASASQALAYASIGTGNSTPIATQTTLDTVTAYSAASTYSNDTITVAGAPTYAATHTITYTFTQGAVIGNMAEVGIGSAAAANALFSRALILDTNSNPTTITLTSLDQLIIYYKLTINPPIVDGTGTVVLNSITYNYTTRLSSASTFLNSYSPVWYAGAGNFSGVQTARTYGAGAALAPITASAPTGTNNAGYITPVTSAYVTNSFSKTHVATWTPTQGIETGGIQAIQFIAGIYGTAAFQVVFNAPIPKLNTTTLTLNFVFSWSR